MGKVAFLNRRHWPGRFRETHSKGYVSNIRNIGKRAQSIHSSPRANSQRPPSHVEGQGPIWGLDENEDENHRSRRFGSLPRSHQSFPRQRRSLCLPSSRSKAVTERHLQSKKASLHCQRSSSFQPFSLCFPCPLALGPPCALLFTAYVETDRHLSLCSGKEANLWLGFARRRIRRSGLLCCSSL